MTENEIKNTKEWFEDFIETYALSNQETIEFKKAVACLEELQQYRAIGTIKELKNLKEKNEPKKIDIWANGEEHCPFCDKNLTTFYGFANCFSCGQKIDWQ